MTKSDKTNQVSNSANQERRRYERPKIVAREPLEAVATVCEPSPPAKGLGVCSIGPIAS